MADLDAQTRDRIEDLAGDMIADEVKNWDAVKLADALRAVLGLVGLWETYAFHARNEGDNRRAAAYGQAAQDAREAIARELGVKTDA